MRRMVNLHVRGGDMAQSNRAPRYYAAFAVVNGPGECRPRACPYGLSRRLGLEVNTQRWVSTRKPDRGCDPSEDWRTSAPPIAPHWAAS